MEVGSVVRAMFDFCPSVSEELPLFVGDVIEVLSVVDEFWLLGCKKGITGQFPSSFVEKLAIPSVQHGEKLFVCVSEYVSHEAGGLSLQPGDLVVLDGTLASGWLQGRNCWGAKGIFPSSCVEEFYLSSRSRQLSQSVAEDLPSYSLGQARALLGLSAQLEEELDFREGDIIVITGVPEPGWFEGELEGKRGIFPEGFVELLGPLRMAESKTKHVSDDKFDDDLSVQDSTSYLSESEEEVRKSEEEEDPMATYGIALYQFQALESKELDFDVGDRIKIVNTLEDGWLEGELHGRRGIFPYRFVKIERRDTEEFSAKAHLAYRDQDQLTYPVGAPLPVQERVCPANLTTAENSRFIPKQPESNNFITPMDIKQKYVSQISENQSPNSGFENKSSFTKDTSNSLPNNIIETVSDVSPKPQLPPRPKMQKSKTYSGNSFERESDYAETPGFTPSPHNAYASEGKCGSSSNGFQNSRSSKVPRSPLKKETARLNDYGRFAGESDNLSGQKSFPYQDLANWTDDQRQKPKRNSTRFSDKPEGHGTWPGGKANGSEVPSGMVRVKNGSDQSMDLDHKLSEQLFQFEKSLSNPRAAEHGKVTRHFSILDYSSERDIVLGSPKYTSYQQKSTERRKVLRPPPPRPMSRATTSPHMLEQQSPQSRSNQNSSPSSAIRPSRPAPLPPPSHQRTSISPKPQPRSGSPRGGSPIPELADDTVQIDSDETFDQEVKEQESQCPFLMLRIEEVERDLDVYSKTREELHAMLDEEQDEMERAETLENLEFCDCNIESLRGELQQLRGADQKQPQEIAVTRPGTMQTTQDI